MKTIMILFFHLSILMSVVVGAQEESSTIFSTTLEDIQITSTMIPTTYEPTTVESPKRSPKSVCQKISSQEILNSGIVTVPMMGNITWSGEMDCFSEFVVFSHVGRTTKKTLLCPTYKIHKLNSSAFSCYANFTQPQCGTKIILTMEAWSKNGKLFEPSVRVSIDCSLKNNISVSLSPIKNVLSPFIRNPDLDEEFEEISPAKVNCRWTEWTPWTPCSVTCGHTPGLRTRSRSQSGSRLCGEIEKQGKKCHVNKCAVDCFWSSWSEWSPCSVSCGVRGKSVRKRKVIRERQYGGKPCIGSTIESKRCSGIDCPVDGSWSSWSTWGYCQSKCGVGNRTRTRTCNDPLTENGGKPCLSDELLRTPRVDGLQVETQLQDCKIKDCEPIHGHWGEWSRWSICSESCGRGQVKRIRKCNSPSPAHGGDECDGQSAQFRPCFLRKCGTESYTQSPSVAEILSSRKKQFPTSSRIKVTRIKEESSKEEDRRNHQVDITSAIFQRLSSTCVDKPPYIHGFLGPFVKDGLNLSRDKRFLRVGEIAYYACNHGKVLDVSTNQRGFFLACREPNGFLVQLRKVFEGDPRWPRCISPQYCLEPAPKFEGYTPPVPRRHSRINSEIRYQCLKNSNYTYTLSCFPDGKYKEPLKPPFICDGSSTISQNDPEDIPDFRLKFRKNNVILSDSSRERWVLNTDASSDALSQEYGWISSPSYPRFFDLTSGEFVLSVNTTGYVLRIGVEDLIVLDEEEDPLDFRVFADFNYDKMDDSFPSSVRSVYYSKKTYMVKSGFSLKIVSKRKRRLRFRFNFQVLAP